MPDPARDMLAAVSDGRVWLAIVVACLTTAILARVGCLVAQRIGMLDGRARRGEVFSVGLSVGLLVAAAFWAAFASGGRSVFVPVALLTLLAVVVGTGKPVLSLRLDRRSIVVGTAAVAFLVAMGLVYASTLAPSPRDGYQPIEFFDVGYYSVLGADLSGTGRESIYSPSGFDAIAGLPDQTWYHWGELWLAAAIIDMTGVSPLHARHLIVLPILLLATATLVGTVANRLVREPTHEYFILGLVAALFLAPIPVLRDPEIEWFARSLTVLITQYGLAAVIVTLALYLVVTDRPGTERTAALLAAITSAALVATHIGLAAAVIAGLGVARVLKTRPEMGATDPEASRRVRGIAFVALAGVAGGAATLSWGFITGHGLGGLAAIDGIASFDPVWWRAVLEVTAGAGVILAAPLLAFWLRGEQPRLVWLSAASAVAVVLGAAAWGLFVGDLNAFHLFFGPIVAMLTPVAIAILLTVLAWARHQGRHRLARIVLIAFLMQTAVGLGITYAQLRAFGPLNYPATPVAALEGLRALPADAKAAYSCQPIENFAPWDASLVAIDAHTGVRMVPMCFIADRARRILGRELDAEMESPYFALAPQRLLWPTYDARPSEAAIGEFLRTHDIHYLFVDPAHPEPVVSGGSLVFAVEGVMLYRIP